MSDDRLDVALSQSSPTVRVERLCVVRSRREVLHDVSFEIARGQLVGLLGPSGSGKSTLMRSLLGVQIIAGGTVELLGLGAGAPGLRTRVGYVTQAPSVYTDLTVHENLRYFADVLGAPASDVERVIEEVDLVHHTHSLVHGMSGGEIARVSLAAALLGAPEVLVLDEPTVGLDPLLRRDLWDLFHRLAAKGVTLIVSSHVMDEAQRCQRLLLVREGRLIFDAVPKELLARTGTTDFDAAMVTLIETAS
ncbi:MAG TPA: ABC transporter ATP-binding protein [Acidimicrobiales bacterium]|nr:ABC transporter ATP-binding protein [Acidimicrobiales bacterium]